jgi:hypothetical protein
MWLQMSDSAGPGPRDGELEMLWRRLNGARWSGAAISQLQISELRQEPHAPAFELVDAAHELHRTFTETGLGLRCF